MTDFRPCDIERDNSMTLGRAGAFSKRLNQWRYWAHSFARRDACALVRDGAENARRTVTSRTDSKSIASL